MKAQEEQEEKEDDDDVRGGWEMEGGDDVAGPQVRETLIQEMQHSETLRPMVCPSCQSVDPALDPLQPNMGLRRGCTAAASML